MGGHGAGSTLMCQVNAYNTWGVIVLCTLMCQVKAYNAWVTIVLSVH